MILKSLKAAQLAILFLFVICVTPALLAQASTATKGKEVSSTKPNFSASGSASLISHFIDHGLSMSNKNPAINAELLLNMGAQFKLGFWGSNIRNVTNPDDNFWVKYLGVIVIDFSKDVKTQLIIADNRFYTSQQRNGQTFTAEFEIGSKYTASVEMNNNFEGTSQSSQYISGGYLYRWKGPWLASAALGYTNQKTSSINNYLDLRTEGIYQPLPKMKFKLGFTGTSDSGQLNGRGAFTYYLAGDFDF